MKNLLRPAAIALLLLLPAAPLSHATAPDSGLVVAAHPLAARAGTEMLARGGNAFDAAAAVALAVGVVEPTGSGIGGGGFFLLHVAGEDRDVMIDARETAPRLAGRGGIYRSRSSIDGPATAGVPGLLAGVDRLIRHYGRLERTTIAAPAIRHAREGFRPTPHFERLREWRENVFNGAARRVYGGEAPIRQPALAETLARFAERGADDFYRGETAGRLVADMKRDGGLIREGDLAAYRAIEREPVAFDFRGLRIVSAALPSSGGLTLATIFGMLAKDDLRDMRTADRAHLLIEVMKRAYRDRNAHLGDADFVEIPDDYVDAARLQRLRASIDMARASAPEELEGVAEPTGAGTDTTHFSIVDAQGNMVAATLSINYPFGSGYVSPSTGVLLNDEMDDFATRPGEPNAYGLVQGEANAVAPGKRMLSSMSPTFVFGPERALVVGTPGGSRIISMVMHAILDFALDETAPERWVAAPRYHHQFLPDAVRHEAGAFSETVAAELRRRGHTLERTRDYGNMQAILFDRRTDRLTGLTDPRGGGAAIGAGQR